MLIRETGLCAVFTISIATYLTDLLTSLVFRSSETTVERRPRAVLDAEGFSQAHQQSATNLHRNKNHRHSSVDSGSLAVR